MRFSSKSMRALAACCAAVGMLFVVGVSSASAAHSWGGATQIKWSGSLTLKLNGGSPVVCPSAQLAGYAGANGEIWGTAPTFGFGCAGSTSFMTYTFVARPVAANPDGTFAFSTILGDGQSPYGPFWVPQHHPGLFNGTVKNRTAPGPAGRPTITFTDAFVGNSASGPITASGVLSVTNQSGGDATFTW